jgi:hypothetical protein
VHFRLPWRLAHHLVCTALFAMDGAQFVMHEQWNSIALLKGCLRDHREASH